MSGYAMVTYAYATEPQYRSACAIEAMRWMGGVVQDGVEGWVQEAQVLLTSPQGFLQVGDDGILATNGRGKVAVLQLHEAGAER